MRNFLLYIIFCLTCFSAKTQILRRDIYNFEINDYYCVEKVYVSGWMPSITTERRLYQITNKYYNSDSSEVEYEAYVQKHLPALPPTTGPGVYTSFFTSFGHYNLNNNYNTTDIDNTFDFFIPIEMLRGPDPSYCVNDDSLILSQTCDTLLKEFRFGIYYNPTDSCSSPEPYLSNYSVYEKGGGPYGYYGQNGDPTASYEKFRLGYRKIGNIECGNFPYGFLKIEELNTDLKNFNIYPQPFTNAFTISLRSELSSSLSYQLVDVFGRTHLQGKLENQTQTIDAKDISSGIYFMLIEDKKGKFISQKVIKK